MTNILENSRNINAEEYMFKLSGENRGNMYLLLQSANPKFFIQIQSKMFLQTETQRIGKRVLESQRFLYHNISNLVSKLILISLFE
jgi:hypothetical protein